MVCLYKLIPNSTMTMAVLREQVQINLVIYFSITSVSWLDEMVFEIFICEAGNVWTTSSHIITAVVGSGVLSLAWSIAQMGWIAGPGVMIFFSVVALYTSSILAECYRCGDSHFGKRNYTFMDAVQNILGNLTIHIYTWVALYNMKIVLVLEYGWCDFLLYWQKNKLLAQFSSLWFNLLENCHVS